MRSENTNSSELSEKINRFRKKISKQTAGIQHLKKDLNESQSKLKILSSKNSNMYDIQSLSEVHVKLFSEEKIESSKARYPLLIDLFINTVNHSTCFSDETVQFSYDIKSINSKCHEMLVQNFNFPSDYICAQLFNKDFADINENFTDIIKTGDIIKIWRRQNNIFEALDATLSVDALYFHPRVKISDKLDISGMETASKNSLKEDIFQFFNKRPELFESFIEQHSHYSLRAAFVFQIQTLNPKFKTFVIHIKQTKSGKANGEIIDFLNQLKKISKANNIHSYAFNGDNCYNCLHQKYFTAYIATLFTRKNIFNIHLNIQRVVCDPFHLFKHLRYRLLSSIIHSGFLKNNPFIDINRLRAVLNHIPTVVFSNIKITKMNDLLPIILFFK